MIYIIKNTVNNIILTLQESTSIVNPNYLFEFIYEDDITLSQYGTDIVSEIYFTTPDLSTSTLRYNKFEITEDDLGSTTSGDDIPLNLKNGQYKYVVYATSIIIDINNIDFNDFTQVEEGRMVVNGDQTNIDPRYN